MLSAIILAAGNSDRMGRPKALLEYGGRLFIEHICGALRRAGVKERLVVLGRDAGVVTSVWKPAGEKIVVNPKPQDGQLSSLRAGIEAADEHARAFMICLADQPAIEPETYELIIDFWRRNKDAVVIPRCRRDTGCASGVPRSESLPFKRGHPVIVPAVYRHLCFEGPLDKGLHWVTHHPSVKVADFDVEDTGIIRDFDTPEQYEELRAGERRTHPR